MAGMVDTIMSYPFAAMLVYFLMGILLLILCLTVFAWITRYHEWEEIRKGNLAAAMAAGGKIFGICNIFRFSIMAGDTIYVSLLRAGFGFLLLIAAYFLFEFLTPAIRVDEEIGRGNRAVGFLAMVISVSLSYIIGAAIA